MIAKVPAASGYTRISAIPKADAYVFYRGGDSRTATLLDTCNSSLERTLMLLRLPGFLFLGIGLFMVCIAALFAFKLRF